MEKDGNIIIPIIGYIIAFIIPIMGLIYGAILVYSQKDCKLYQKHGRFIIYFAIIIFVINLILRLTILS